MAPNDQEGGITVVVAGLSFCPGFLVGMLFIFIVKLAGRHPPSKKHSFKNRGMRRLKADQDILRKGRHDRSADEFRQGR